MKVFIAGPRAISVLDKNIEERLHNIYSNDITVIVGDAEGIDTAVQKYFYRLGYSNVNVYATQGKARNNIGSWNVETVDAGNKHGGFEYFAAKDLKMAEDTDYGFMIWNGTSKGTLNNIINLIYRNKRTLMYFVPESRFYCIEKIPDLEKVITKCVDATRCLYEKFKNVTNSKIKSAESSEYEIAKQITF